VHSVPSCARVQAGVTAAKGEEEKTPLAKKLDEFGA
jgi:hypothetical protein